MDDDSAKRARVAYDTFRNGCPFGGFGSAPEWEKAPVWVRDVVLVAYLQGKLDQPRSEPHYKVEDGPDGMVRRYQDGYIVRP